MKFGRLLRDTASDLPQIHTLYSGYKKMKKELKRTANPNQQCDAGAHDLTSDESCFVESLTAVLQELNDVFLEREEDSIIVLHELEACVATCNGLEAQRQLYREFVDFHGKLLLNMHWSVLAYTTVVKILKKYHKKTGLLLRAPQLADLMSQPFCSTEDLNVLVRRAEAWINQLKPTRAAQNDSAQDATMRPQQLSFEPGTLGASGQQEGSPIIQLRFHDQAPSGSDSDCDSCSFSPSIQSNMDVEPGMWDSDYSQSGLDDTDMDSTFHAQLSRASSLRGVGEVWSSSVAQQTQIALTTWQQLWLTAATPSTVFSGIAGPTEIVDAPYGPSQQ